MSPEERFEAINTLSQRSTGYILDAGILLYKAHAEKDWARLGVENWAAYLDALGVSKSQDSKTRTAVRIFGGAWKLLPPGDQRMLTLERLYQAARITDRDHLLSVEEGLSLAVAHPAHVLVGMLKGEDASPRPVHPCPDCGHEHVIKGSAA